MPFSSLLFVHLFLPAFLIAYWLTPRRARNGTAIFASLVFYAWGAPTFLPVVLGLGLTDYVLSHRIAARREVAPREARLLLGAGVTMHLSVLAYFKYSNFFVEQLSSLVGPIPWAHVALPIGISFITFEEISYLVDVYRGDARPARRLSQYVLFLTLFPHSIAGPIFRWKDLEAQLETRVHDWSQVREGFERFSLGLAKKVLIADSVAIIADAVFDLPTNQLTWHLAWAGALAYTIQIYFDFSGYSDMAIGLGKMIGFTFKENFDRPYIASSLTEFWTRWHISLSRWLRDYLYVPLGGNRLGRSRALLNIMIVFALSGLWHGAAWTFVLWGVFHGTLVMVERVLGDRRDHLPLIARHVITLLLIVVGWVLFRSESAPQAASVLGAMLGLGDASVAPPPAAEILPRFAQLALVLGGAIVLAPIIAKYRRGAPRAWPRPALLAVRAGYLVLFTLSAIHLTNMRITPLIYFKF